jgi:UDP-N-acetylglucosamine:LPS N-acetylglucosamine transferase
MSSHPSQLHRSPVLIMSTTEGHLSMAQTLKTWLADKKIDAALLIVDEPAISWYRPFYRYFPWAMRGYFAWQQFPLAVKLVSIYSRLFHTSAIENALKIVQPQVVLSTDYGCNAAFLQLTKKHSTPIPLFNFVTDPRTFFKANIEEGAELNFVFDETTLKNARRVKPRAKIVAAGWPVRPAFFTKTTQKQARQQLQLDPHTFTILVASGSEGMNQTIELIPELLSAPEAVQLVVATGSNHGLFEKVSALKSFQPTNSETRLLPVSFTDQMHLYFQAADLIVGKAGPNMLFEAVASHKPFVASTHIQGQEDGNLEIIEQYQVGIVAEKSGQATQVTRRILANVSELDQFTTPIAELAKVLANTQDLVWQKIKPHLHD